LELLEELLLQYQGTLFLVSHDRAILNNVVTSSLVLEGDGRVGEYVGGYDDWLRLSDARNSALQRSAPGARQQPKKSPTQNNNKKSGKKPEQKKGLPVPASITKKAKLSYKDQRELDALPELIASLEAEQSALYVALSTPDLHASEPDKARDSQRQLKDIESKLNKVYARWEELEALQ